MRHPRTPGNFKPDQHIANDPNRRLWCGMSDDELRAVRDCEWRDVVGYEGYYAISEFGDVVRVDRAPTDPRYGSLLKRSSPWNIQLWKLGAGETLNVAALVLLAWRVEQPTPWHHGRHRDGNPLNCHISNVYWGLMPNATITPELASEIKAAADAGVSATHLAKHYCVSRRTISNALHGITWNGTDGPEYQPLPGPGARGEEALGAVLTEDQVIEARRLNATIRCADLAKRYGVDSSTLAHAITGRTWSHLPGARASALVDDPRGRYSRKLSPEDVGVIVERLARGDVQRQIAADFGVHETIVSKIKHGKRLSGSRNTEGGSGEA